MKNKNFFRNFLIVIVLLVLAFGGLKFYYDYLLSPLDASKTSNQSFVIKKGEATSVIAERLQKEGLVRSTKTFMLLLKFSGDAGKIQAGNFLLSPSLSNQEILEKIKAGATDKWVTLLEGWRVEEEAAKLHQELGIDKEEFMKVAKEGYMFPDTYLFNKDIKVADIVQIMKDNFNKKYGSSLQNKIKKLGLTPEEGVILASIVEREARSDEARRMVASILLKRFKIGMGLNVDASIQYILGYQNIERSWWKRNLTKNDLKTESPYNTYLYKGLTPGPISNPGLSALQAVAEADSSTPYLYYYHDSKGISHYGKTLEEHNENIANYP